MGIATNEQWIVTLEAAAETGHSSLSTGGLQHLTEALSGLHARSWGNDHSYVLRLRVEAGGEAEALFGGISQWRDVVRMLGLPVWRLARAEVTPADDPDGSNQTSLTPTRTFGSGPEAVVGDDLLRRALHDSLTGVVSEVLFRDRVRLALAEAAGDWAVMVWDLDNFAVYNRVGGPALGDRVLARLASRVSRVFGETVVGRLGGDSFAVLVADGGGIEVDEVAKRLLDVIRAPVDIDGRRVNITASVGVAVSDALCHPDDLIRRAATAMCVAKAHGGDCALHFDPSDSVDLRRLESVSEVGPDRLAYALLLERAAVAANECTALESAAAIVLQQVCAHTGWPLGHLGVTSADGAQIEATTLWHVRGGDRFEMFRAMIEHSPQTRGDRLAGRVLESGHMAWTDEFGCGGAGFRAAAAAAGSPFLAGYAFPVLVGPDVVAVLEFYTTRSAPLDPSLREVMSGVGAQLGRVVERSRAQAALAQTEIRYRTLADSVPVLLWMSGLDTHSILFNRAWLEFTGRPLEAELSDRWADAVHPDDHARWREIYRRAFKRREPFEIEYRLRRADGEYRWVLDRAQPLGRGDDFQGYVGGCTDITDRRHAEAQGRQNEARFRALVENSGGMITMLDGDGSIIAQYLGGSIGVGYPEGSTTGRLGFDFLHPDDLERTLAAFRNALDKPGLGEAYQCRVRHADGTWRWVEAIANNLLDYPPVQAVVISSHDITEKKQLEQSLADAEDKLRQLADHNHLEP